MKNKVKVTVLFCVVAFIVSGVLSFSIPIFFGRFQANASGGSVTQSPPGTGGSCANASITYTYEDDCYGVTWRYYKANSDRIVIAGNGEATTGGVIEGCKKFGGYYFRLGREAYIPSVWAYSGWNPTAGSLGYQVGLLNVYETEPPFGRTPGGAAVRISSKSAARPNGESKSEGGSLAWNYVRNEFERAYNYALERKRLGQPYDGNILDSRYKNSEERWQSLSAFCWNKDQLINPSDTNFIAYSVASTTGHRANSYNAGPDGHAEANMTTEKDYVDIDFYHRLVYEKGSNLSSLGKVGDAITVWNTTVKENGSNVTAQATFSDVRNSNSKEVIWYNEAKNHSQKGKMHVEGNSGKKENDGQVGISHYTVDMTKYKNGQTARVCSYIDYQKKTIAWKKSGDTYYMDDKNSSGSGESYACINITRSSTPPPPTEDVDEEEMSVKFLSTSTVEVPDDQEGILGKAEDHIGTSDIKADDDTVTVHLSTDSDHIKFNFWHNLYWQLQDENHNEVELKEGDDLPLDKLCTKYGVERFGQLSIDGGDFNSFPVEPSIIKEFGQQEFCAKKENLYHDGGETGKKNEAVSVSENVEIKDLQFGQTVRVCEKITYNPSRINVTQKTKTTTTYDEDGNPIDTTEDGTEYIIGDGNNQDGSSTACIEVTRPKDPDYPNGNNPEGPYIDSFSSSSSQPMFAGESSTIGWGATAVAYKTRQIVEWQSVVFQPAVTSPLGDGTITKGNILDDDKPNLDRTTKDPCVWYTEKIGALRQPCVIKEKSTQPYPTDSTIAKFDEDRQYPVKVPDQVGDKYCTAFGIGWQAWSGITHSRGDIPEKWTKDGDVYWTNYDAACRTIAKKPSASLWNGGIFTSGGIKTSVASRYIPAGSLGEEARTAPNRTFGSWTEYLAVVGKRNYGFASGGTYAFKGSLSGDILENSPLTIANNAGSDTLGNSGVNGNSSFVSRLGTYLFGNHTDVTVLNDNPSGQKNITDTRIYDHSGTLTITDDIIVTNNPISSIYRLPQVIIHANNIEIAENVTRIDAWLIADNEINTCGAFDSSTEAYVTGWTQNTRCSKQLTVNGPVIAQKLKLNRTAGADPIAYGAINNNTSDNNYVSSTDGSGADPRSFTGEVFNLSANTYLWAYAQAGRYNSSYTESYTRELPPRY